MLCLSKICAAQLTSWCVKHAHSKPFNVGVISHFSLLFFCCCFCCISFFLCTQHHAFLKQHPYLLLHHVNTRITIASLIYVCSFTGKIHAISLDNLLISDNIEPGCLLKDFTRSITQFVFWGSTEDDIEISQVLGKDSKWGHLTAIIRFIWFYPIFCGKDHTGGGGELENQVIDVINLFAKR